MTFSSSERSALAQTLLEKGPDAPTLCGDWTTRDLAVHLWIRENKPLTQLKSMLPGDGDAIGVETEKALERPYEEIVRKWAEGPRGLSPWRIVDPVANGVEHFVHHEDVLRGHLEPGDPVDERELAPEHRQYLYRAVKLTAGRAVTSDRPVIIDPDGFSRIIVNDKPGVSPDGEAVVRVSGGVGEILLWIFGRDVVDLSFSGDDSSVARLNL